MIIDLSEPKTTNKQTKNYSIMLHRCLCVIFSSYWHIGQIKQYIVPFSVQAQLHNTGNTKFDDATLYAEWLSKLWILKANKISNYLKDALE